MNASSRQHARWLRAEALSALVVASVLAGTALAQAVGGSYTLNKQAIGSGGGRASAGALAIETTVGLPAASNVLSGGAYTLTAGVRSAATSLAANEVFENGFE